ncbi:hypothetical protein ACINK0_12105 [Deinococcus sp. VB343]|uniref:hypothetical protein n=1 Tax=Deinococcus sp. VB343 TaxID=3385567 RepID=UPI0039C9DCD7
MKRAMSFLLALSAPLWARAGAVSVSGAVAGEAAPETRLAAWAVSPFGQPLQALADSALTADRFALTLPDAAPAERLRFAVGERTSWPGLVDFAGASAPVSATEVKFFVYQDANRNGVRDEGETLREVRLNAGKSDLFVVWSSAAVTVRGGGGYQADLKAGWNVMTVELRKSVKVAPYAGGPLQLDLNR